MTGVLAAVVGVIANLALFFAVHTIFNDVETTTGGVVRIQVPNLASIDPASSLIAVVAAALLFRYNWPVLRTLGACATLGLITGIVTAAAS